MSLIEFVRETGDETVLGLALGTVNREIRGLYRYALPSTIEYFGRVVRLFECHLHRLAGRLRSANVLRDPRRTRRLRTAARVVAFDLERL